MRAFSLCLWLVCVAVSAAAEQPQRRVWRVWPDWTAEAQKQHPLAGRIYDVGSGKLSSLANGPGFALQDGIALLGEVHDNPAHHRLRGWLIAESLRARPNWRPAVVFEHIRVDLQPVLDQRRLAPGEECCRITSAADLLSRLQWDKSGWPSAKIFEPLFDAVLGPQLPIYPGDPPREKVRAVARGGLTAIEVYERRRLQLDLGLPTPLAEALNKELAESHCGALPPQAIPGMAAAQRYRDAHLADALLRAEKLHGSAILIAGNGHVRTDRGVPWHLRQARPNAKVLSVLLLEVEEGKTDPATYVPRDPDGNAAADLVIFTLRAKRDDPCQEMIRRRK